MKETNRKRLALPDTLRGLALISLIIVHVLNLYGSHSLDEGWGYGLLQFLAGPPAGPLFMCVMGFLFILKKPGFRDALKRGLLLLLLGYGLNLVKGFLPITIARNILGWNESLLPSLYTPYYLIFNVEILMMAGLSYIAMGWISSLTTRPVAILLMALTVMIVSPFLWGRGEEIPLLKHLLNPVWGGDPDLVIFPFFPWFSYPLLGMAAGEIYKRDYEVKRLRNISLMAGSALLLIGGLMLFINFERFFHDYGQQSWGAVIAFSGFLFLWGNLIYLIQRIYPEKMKTGLLKFFSRKLTLIYCLQWIIIGWLFFLIPFHSLSMGLVLLTSLGVILTLWGTLFVIDRINLRKAAA